MTGFFESILTWIFGWVQNYGWSVVIFTLVIRLVLMPLDFKSKKSMRAMTKLQPKMQELQKKYGKDKEKYNQKVQDLYRREKISPMSGCLPMLIQLPLLFIMFGAMRSLANKQMMDMLIGIKDAVEGAVGADGVLTTAQAADIASRVPLQSWLWIKNVFQPDSFMSSILPTSASALNAVSHAELESVKAFLSTENYALIAAQLGANDFIRIPLNLIFFQPTLVLPNSLDALFSSANGLFILPLFAALSQFFMTKLTSPKTEPGQEPQPGNMNSGLMKWLFPLMSLWFCAGYNAAFAIYWCIGNVIAIFQQYFINLYFDRKDKLTELTDGQPNT